MTALPPQAIAAKQRLIEAAAPHLIDMALHLMGLSTVPAAIPRGVVAEALARCGNDPHLVAELRFRWIESLEQPTNEERSWLSFVRRQRP